MESCYEKPSCGSILLCWGGHIRVWLGVLLFPGLVACVGRARALLQVGKTSQHLLENCLESKEIQAVEKDK